MASKVSHYMVDCFDAKGLRVESFHIKALNADQAIAEARIFAPMKKPHHFQVRAVARKGDSIIYRSTDADGP